jgi:hypothetical protein
MRKQLEQNRVARLSADLDVSAKAEVEPEYLSPQGAEMLSGVSRWTWRFAAYDGRIESCKIGNRLLIPVVEIRRLLREGTRPRKDGLPAGVPAARRQRKNQAEGVCVG